MLHAMCGDIMRMYVCLPPIIHNFVECVISWFPSTKPTARQTPKAKDVPFTPSPLLLSFLSLFMPQPLSRIPHIVHDTVASDIL
jgi:hypothetical protein